MTTAMIAVVIRLVIAFVMAIAGLISVIRGATLYQSTKGAKEDGSVFELSVLKHFTLKAKPSTVGAVMVLTAPAWAGFSWLTATFSVKADDEKHTIEIAKLKEDVQRLTVQLSRRHYFEEHQVAYRVFKFPAPNGATLELQYVSDGMNKAEKDATRQKLEDFIIKNNVPQNDAVKFRELLESTLKNIPEE